MAAMVVAGRISNSLTAGWDYDYLSSEEENTWETYLNVRKTVAFEKYIQDNPQLKKKFGDGEKKKY